MNNCYALWKIGKGKHTRIMLIDIDFYLHWSEKKKKISCNSNGYGILNIKNKLVLVHRYIFERFYKTKLTRLELIDHINGNVFDNRISNLRVCSHSENLCNRGVQKNSTTNIKNVYFDKHRCKWVVRINKCGKTVFCKRYETKEEAIRVATEKRNFYHKEYTHA